MEIFRLENIEYLYGLLFIPVLAIIYSLMRRRRRKALEKYGEAELIGTLYPDVSNYKPILKFLLLLAGFTFLVFAIAKPQIGSKLEEYKREGVDIIIALDVSNSMKAEDIKPNRLDRAKQAVSRLIDELQGDRIGLIVFAGTSFLQHPLTADYSAAKLLLSTADTDMMPTQGTAIGGAIELAMDSFDEEDDKNKVLIIITDGENHEDDALGMAAEAAKKGIFIHTIGMGALKGGPIPIYSRGTRTGFRKNNEGDIIVTKMDAAMLQQIAASGNGRFIRSAGSDPDLSQLLDEIDKMEKKEFESKLFTDYEDRFQYFVAAALIFLLFEFIVSEKKNKFIASFNIFGERKL